MEQNETKMYGVKIKKLPRARIEITAAIPAAEFDRARSEAIKHIGSNAELPGFRRGHVPESLIVAKLGEEAILEEMAEIAIGKAYPAIIQSEKLDVLGRPEVRITKIARGNPLEFNLTTAIFPEVNLPEYKKLAGKEAAKREAVAVTDDEVQKTIEQILRMRNNTDKDEREADDQAPLPALDDAFVKTLGDFTSVEDFKTKLRENMLKEKTRAVKDKKRIAIIDAILAKTTIELPEIIVAQELARMEDEFAHDVLKMGLTMDAYLQAVKKTKEELVRSWQPDAEKRAKTQLVVSKIAELEKIEPDAEMVKKEAAALRRRYPDASEERAENYVRMLLGNEKVFEFLESQES